MNKANFIARFGTSDQIHKIIDSDDHFSAAYAAKRNAAFSKEHSDKMLAHSDRFMREMAVSSSPHVTEDQLKAAQKDEHLNVSSTAFYKHFAEYHTGEQLLHVIRTDPDPAIQDVAFHAAHAENKFDSRHYKALLGHPNTQIRNVAMRHYHLVLQGD